MSRFSSPRAGRAVRRWIAVWLLASAALGRVWAQGEMAATFFACGQGEAALLETPGGRRILLDGGPLDPDGGFDAGRDILVPWLKSRGVERLDWVVVSHPHLDHFGGLGAVLEEFPVSVLCDAGDEGGAPEYAALLEAAERKGVTRRIARSGDLLGWDPALEVRVLGPPSPFLGKNVNDNSLVIQVRFGDVSWLFTGDIEKEAEYDLVIRHGSALRSRILKVPHHGARTSSTPEFLEQVRPEAAVVSFGRRNPFGHPSQRVLERYRGRGTDLFLTGAQGHVRIVADGKTYRVRVLSAAP